MWKLFKLGQGPRPDLLAEQWAREAAEEEAREREREAEEAGAPSGSSVSCGDDGEKVSRQTPLKETPAPSPEEDPAGVWIEEQRGPAEEKRETFRERTETPKPSRKDFVAMCVALAELLIPIALALVGLFALLIFLLQKFWLHA